MKAEITIKMHGKDARVDADITGDWAIHVMSGLPRCDAIFPWTLTHIPTGYGVAHFADRATALKARKAASMAPQFKTIRPQDEIGEVWADYLKQIGRGPWDEVRRSYQRITGRELVLA